MNEELYKEYITFKTTTKDGSEIEMAVLEEFEFEKKNYVVSAVVEDDTINDENIFIYRLILKAGDEFDFEKISDAAEYERVAKAYMEME